MIVVKVELHSAITGQTTELARMVVCNDGTAKEAEIGNYNVYVATKGQTDNRTVINQPQRTAQVKNHRRLAYSVWVLIKKALISAGY